MAASDGPAGATPRTLASKIASPDDRVTPLSGLTAHVALAASIGGGLATIVEWGIEIGAHVTTPTQVDDAISAICIFGVSLMLRKVAG